MRVVVFARMAGSKPEIPGYPGNSYGECRVRHMRRKGYPGFDISQAYRHLLKLLQGGFSFLHGLYGSVSLANVLLLCIIASQRCADWYVHDVLRTGRYRLIQVIRNPCITIFCSCAGQKWWIGWLKFVFDCCSARRLMAMEKASVSCQCVF